MKETLVPYTNDCHCPFCMWPPQKLFSFVTFSYPYHCLILARERERERWENFFSLVLSNNHFFVKSSHPLISKAITGCHSWLLHIKTWWMVLDLVHTSEAQMDHKHSASFLFFFFFLLWCYTDPTTIYLLISLTHNGIVGLICGWLILSDVIWK